MSYSYLLRAQRSWHDVTGGSRRLDRERSARTSRLRAESRLPDRFPILVEQIREFMVPGKEVKAKYLAERFDARHSDVMKALRHLGAIRRDAFYVLPTPAPVNA